MLRWLGKVLGGGDGKDGGSRGNGGNGDETPGIPAAWKQALHDRMALPIAQPPHLRAGLPDELIRFLLTGEPESVLDEAAQSVNVGQVMGTSGYGHLQDGRFYAEVEQLPEPVLLRWAALLTACISGRVAGSGSSPLHLALPAGAQWVEVMLLQSANLSLNHWGSNAVPTLPFPLVERLLVAIGHDPALPVIAAFSAPYNWRQKMIPQMPGFAEALDRHLDRVELLLSPVSVEGRLHVLEVLRHADPKTLARLAPQLAPLAVVSSRQVREAADLLVRAVAEAAVPLLQRLAVEEKPDQRQHALRLLHSLGRRAERQEWIAFARETATADKAVSVQSLLTEWDAAEASVGEEDAAALAYELPVIDWAGDQGPPDEVLQRFKERIDQAVAKDNEDTRKRHEEAVARGHKWELHLIETVSAERHAELRTYLRSGAPLRKTTFNMVHRGASLIVVREVEALVKEGELTAVAAMKMLHFFDLAVDSDGELRYHTGQALEILYAQRGLTLLELSQIVAGLGAQPAGLIRNYCRGWGLALGNDWPDEAVWPFAAHHLDAVIGYVTKATSGDYAFERTKLFQLIRTMPALPPLLLEKLFTLAFEGGKADRALAQQALAKAPGREERLIAALSDGKSETRANAAAWLCKLRLKAAQPALEQAVKREKQDLAKGAMLEALMALGEPVEKYLDRRAIDAEAKKLLAKGVHKDLEWFPWSALPPVRWSDTGEALAPQTLQWLLVQAFKLKTPEPNAMLRKYAGMFDARDRELLGQFVLDAWMAEDVRPIAADDAMTRAKADAASTHASMTRYPQYYENSGYLGKSVEEITAMVLPGFLRQPAGTAIASKGLLAVAAACAAERAAPPVQRYLKEWYGQRAAQGKALIAMLAWIEHPSATQLMLAVGSRFRTKSFQEEATRQATLLADRKGWTLAELADRTVPSAGFDERGELALNFGPREFIARLLPDFKVELFNPDGKKIAALPEPRQDDDAELAKDAKKAFSAAKKELKGIVTLQTDRLYEALCTARSWPAADWSDFLQGHPVLRHLVQRLVWVEVDPPIVHEDETADEAAAAASASLAAPVVRRSFRPLDDGTLSDVEDGEVTLAEDSHVRIAHDSLLGEAEVRAWLQHLADYEIAPLFQQLGKGVYRLPQEQVKAIDVRDFEGHLIETFALRGRALKLGYVRGATEDGGWFYRYEKRFPTLGLEALIEFTGNGLPETNRTVALMALGFHRQAGGSSRALPLSQVPAILLSECFNDLRLIAADGPGFDAEWRKKSEY